MKRICSFIAVLAILISGLGITAAAQTQTVFPLVPGVDLINIRRSVAAGDQNIHIVKADLNNSNLALKLLHSDNGVNTLENVQNLANANHAIAAINADFFAWGAQSGTGSPAGYNVSDGELLSTPSVDERLASLAFDENGTPVLAYFQQYITVTTPRGESMQVKHINKFDPMDGIVLYTRAWNEYSLGEGGNMIEVVVENDIVTDIRIGQPPVAIPENGYVLAGLADVTNFLNETIHMGDQLQLDVTITPNINPQLAIGGGTILVTEGQEAAIEHGPSGRNPRSAIGTDATGKIIYLVAVDGRGYGNSIGMTLPELRSFLIELGVYNAINLDGGGSTQMMVRKAGETQTSAANYPSQNPYRKVTNAAAIVPLGEQGKFYTITPVVDNPNMFLGTGLFIDVAAYDELFYPYSVNLADVELSVSGIGGTIENNVFYPSETGTAVIEARYEGKAGSIQVQVLDAPVQLKLDQQEIRCGIGESVGLNLVGIDAAGNEIYINPGYIDVSVTGNIAQKTPGGITGLTQGIGVVRFQVGSAVLEVNINVGNATRPAVSAGKNVVDTFEGDNGTAVPYPENVPCAYKITEEQQQTGYASGKLWYDFTTAVDAVRSAAVQFTVPKTVEQPSTIGVWTYASADNGQWLRLMLTDANGEVQRLTLADTVDWNGWKKVELDLPRYLAYPVQITRLYLVQADQSIQSKGAVYFDDLSITPLPQAPVFEFSDEIRGTQSVEPVMVTAGVKEENNFLNAISQSRLNQYLEQGEKSLNLNGNNTAASNAIERKAPSKTQTEAATVFQIPNNEQGIEAVNSETWSLLVPEEITTPAVILAMDQEPVFPDETEQNRWQEFLDALAEKNTTVFVVWSGDASSVRLEGAARYISLGHKIPSLLSAVNSTEVLSVYVKDGAVKYDVETFEYWHR